MLDTKMKPAMGREEGIFDKYDKQLTLSTSSYPPQRAPLIGRLIITPSHSQFKVIDLNLIEAILEL